MGTDQLVVQLQMSGGEVEARLRTGVRARHLRPKP